MISIEISKDCKDYWKGTKEYRANIDYALSKLKRYIQAQYDEGNTFDRIFNNTKIIYSIIDDKYYVYKYRGPSVQIRFLYTAEIINKTDLKITILEAYHKCTNDKRYFKFFREKYSKTAN